MKLEEMREKTVDELKAEVVERKKQLFDLRVQKSLNKLENTAQIGKVKREIAQIKTVINEKAE
ncbi:MAG: 50S ribosomal protein L29 [Candidatus Gastranaerophilaceae bacterium]